MEIHNTTKNLNTIEKIVKNTEVIFFDLNKTIADVEWATLDDISKELSLLSKDKKIVITSWYDQKWLRDRFLNVLNSDFNKDNLYFASSNWSELIKFNEKWEVEKEVYSFNFTKEEENKFQKLIKDTIEEFNKNSDLAFENKWTIDYRWTQITFKWIKEDEYTDKEKLALDKNNWDSDKKRRTQIIEILKSKLEKYNINPEDYSFQIWGSTSIDINKTDNWTQITKATAIKNISKELEIDLSKITYIWDDMQEWWNDSFARKLEWLNVIEVNWKVRYWWKKWFYNTLKELNEAWDTIEKRVIPDTLVLVKNMVWLMLSEKIEKIKKAQVIISDLDETIIPSKEELKDETQIQNIIDIINSWKKLYIITWWKYDTIMTNLVEPINKFAEENSLLVNFENLILAPVSGAEIYQFENIKNEQILYRLESSKNEYNFSLDEQKEIKEKLKQSLKALFTINPYWKEIEKIIKKEQKWKLLENRWKILALSLFWQEASTKTKKKLNEIEKKYNIDIRIWIIHHFLKENKKYELIKAGSTTIDIKKIINWKPLDKWVWYEHIANYIENKEKVIWIWDNNKYLWNDQALAKAVKQNWGTFINPRNEEEGVYIFRLLKNKVPQKTS